MCICKKNKNYEKLRLFYRIFLNKFQFCTTLAGLQIQNRIFL